MTEHKKNAFYDNLDLWQCPNCSKLHDPRIYCPTQLMNIFPPAFDPDNPEHVKCITEDATRLPLEEALAKLRIEDLMCSECGGTHENGRCLFTKITYEEKTSK